MKYEIGTELWNVHMAGVHARTLGQTTNPYDFTILAQHPLPGMDLLEKQEAWQTGWQRADDGICREED